MPAEKVTFMDALMQSIYARDMGANTPVWIARYSTCGDKLMGLTDGDPIELVTAPDE